MSKTWEYQFPRRYAIEEKHQVENFDVWGIDFMGPFPMSE
jgi:hypothetical protein